MKEINDLTNPKTHPDFPDMNDPSNVAKRISGNAYFLSHGPDAKAWDAASKLLDINEKLARGDITAEAANKQVQHILDTLRPE